MAENPDRTAILRFAAGGVPGPMRTSPLLEALDASLEEYEAGPGRLVMGFAPGPVFRQGAGFVQGGAMAAMLDFVMAFTGMAAVGEGGTVTTTSMTTHYLAGARGEAFRVTGEVEKAGRRMIYVRARLEEGGKAVATASSALLVV